MSLSLFVVDYSTDSKISSDQKTALDIFNKIITITYTTDNIIEKELDSSAEYLTKYANNLIQVSTTATCTSLPANFLSIQ